MATPLSNNEILVWKKVLSSKGKAMTEVQIAQSLPELRPREAQACVMELINKKMLKPVKKDDGTYTYHAEEPKDAKEKKKQIMTPEQTLIYTVVSNAGSKGVSQRHVRNMVGAESIPMAVVRKTLEALEKAGYITSFKGILQPTISLFIRAGLTPAKDITGGVWYDNQKEYDAEFVNGITGFFLNRVRIATYPPEAKRPKDFVDIVPRAIYSTSRTPRLPTPYTLLEALQKHKVTQAPLSVTNVMECMRALELDGLVEAIKPIGGVAFPDEDERDDMPAKKKRKNGAVSEDDEDEEEERRQLELQRAKEKARLKERKRKEKQRRRAEKKQRERERKERRREKKERERERKKRKKEKDKEKRRKERASDGSGKKKKYPPSEDEAEDSDPLIDIDEAPLPDEVSSIRKRKGKRVIESSDEEGSGSEGQSDSETETESDSESEVESDESASSVDSDEIDERSIAIKPRTTAAQIDADVQASAFARTSLTDLDDTRVVYRATSLLNVPLGQTQLPCGKCPQFNFCQEGGPVDPDSCQYMDDWLGDIIGGWNNEGREMYKEPPADEMDFELEVDVQQDDEEEDED